MRPLETIAGYHEATKHHPHRYARSLGYMDWDSQPDPFRRYAGAPLFRLPMPHEDTSPPYDALYTGSATPRPLSVATVSAFYRYSLGLSAWKQIGQPPRMVRWELRCDPSSGNLHPTEGYAVLPPLEGLAEAGGVYHYAPREHGLEQRRTLPADLSAQLFDAFPPGTFFAGLASIHWREAWKYGERAYRYCQHDAGHALGALAASAAALGWRLVRLDGMADDALAALLALPGLDATHDALGFEPERPDLLAAVVTSDGEASAPRSLDPDAVARVAALDAAGAANRLSDDHVEWEVIDAADAAARKPHAPGEALVLPAAAPVASHEAGASAWSIIHQRRSAVAMDGETRLSRASFEAMLARTVPRLTPAFWRAWPAPPSVHLALFVHRVDGVEPGLYALVRAPDALQALRDAMNPSFAWEALPGVPGELPLYFLAPGDVRTTAAQVSCVQDIAGDGAFSLGMLAAFDPELQRAGAWRYRELFWETGLIGQVLYLEAEAHGVRATGIGCFFDDVMHQLLGVEGRPFQSLYHFTVGAPVEDARLTTLPPYPEERLAVSGWESAPA